MGMFRDEGVSREIREKLLPKLHSVHSQAPTRITLAGGGVLLLLLGGFAQIIAAGQSLATSEEFFREARRVLPIEAKYDFHRKLKDGPVHELRRNPGAVLQSGEMSVGGEGWRIIMPRTAGPVLREAVRDFREYLQVSMRVHVEVEEVDAPLEGRNWRNAVIVGRAEDMPRAGGGLRGPKDHHITVAGDLVTVCGYDEIGALQALFHLEARMNLREAPFLEIGLDATRHSIYQTRMVLNYLGWMEWSDNYLSQVAHAGYDAIYASTYANPNGAEGTSHYVLIKPQDPEAVRDLIKRAGRYGIRVYTPLLYRYAATEESEKGLRRLIGDIFTKTPGLKGFVLLTEGFIFDTWFGAGGEGKIKLEDWAANWTKAVRVVVEECRRRDPEFEVLPWEYNVDFRPQQAELKRYIVGLLPAETVPLLTWENGKSFDLGGLRGYARDYSASLVGPAEVTEAQMAEAKKRGMRIFSKADTFASWQFGTVPYLPIPYQWHRRYEALKEHGVNGTMESWSYGYKPNFVSDLFAWYCWSGTPPLDELLRGLARREFGAGNEALVMGAWRNFSEAITLLPDTAPSMGNNFALGNPLFFYEPEPRTMTLEHSWWDPLKWRTHLAARIHPLWPFTRFAFSFIPDFTNRTNMAVRYAENSSGVARMEDRQTIERRPVLPLFMDRVRQTEEKLEEGLQLYRAAALKAPDSKRQRAFREVNLVEQMKRMMGSLSAVLEFEDLRFRLMETREADRKKALLDRMVEILRAEKVRVAEAIESARWDSRLGFEMEMDYLYTPHVLTEKMKVLDQVLTVEIPDYKTRNGIR